MLIHLACDNDIHPPLFGATQRLFGLARGMARRAEVHALCVVPNRSRGAAHETVDGVVLQRVKSWHTSVAWWLERGHLAPLFTAESGHRARASAYARALGAEPDACLADLMLTGMLERPGAGLRVYHAQNVEAPLWAATGPRVLARAHWAGRLAAIERRAVEASDLCLACTDEDAAALRERYGAREVEVIPNGYDERVLAPPAPGARERARAALGIAPEAHVVAFAGGDWGPNRESLALLLDRVMPQLASEGIVLLVVGGIAAHAAGRREPWLRTVPATPDLGAVLAAADAGVNPVLSGGGSNVKLPTYLALGLAVVSTPFGTRGYASLSGAVQVASATDLAAALRARPRGWHARGEAPPTALAEHAWGALGERLAGVLAARRAPRERGAA